MMRTTINLWRQLGGRLGATLILAGFALLFLGWNGAASFDRVPSQLPYVISGALAGICLVIVGAALLVVESQRRATAELRTALSDLDARLRELATVQADDDRALATSTAPTTGSVVFAGSASFHRSSCHLLRQRAHLDAFSPEAAISQGLTPCRLCRPLAPGTAERALESASTENGGGKD